MTDPNLAEQAEREIQEELGFKWDRGYMAPDTIDTPDGSEAIAEADEWHKAMWQALVRDRCSLLKLRKAAEWTQETPKEQGDYWHWDGDEDHAPFIKQVMVSMPSGRTFAAYPDSRWCGVIGGWWQKIEQPSVAALRSALEGK